MRPTVELVTDLFSDDWAIRLFTGLTNLPTPELRLSAAELARYEGRYTRQIINEDGTVTTDVTVMTAHDGGLRVAGDDGAYLLTFYRSPFGPGYAVVKTLAGAPAGARVNFVYQWGGQVAWFRFGGRLNRHEL